MTQQMRVCLLLLLATTHWATVLGCKYNNAQCYEIHTDSFSIYPAPAPSRQYSCMSYQENDSSRHDDDLEQENSEGISAEQLQEDPQELQREEQQLQQLLEPSATPSEPHKRNCPEGYTFCFTLWSQTSNGTKLVKQGE